MLEDIALTWLALESVQEHSELFQVLNMSLSTTVKTPVEFVIHASQIMDSASKVIKDEGT